MVALVPAANQASGRVLVVAASGTPNPGSGRIGRSGFATWADFARGLEGVYSNAYNQAQERWNNMTPEDRARTSRRPANLREGSYLDRESRRAARAWIQSQGLTEGPGQQIQVDRVLRNPDNRRQYVRPDLYVRGVYLGDGSRTTKTVTDPQISNMMSWAGISQVRIIRTTHAGGNYSVIGSGYTGSAPFTPLPAPNRALPRRGR